MGGSCRSLLFALCYLSFISFLCFICKFSNLTLQSLICNLQLSDSSFLLPKYFLTLSHVIREGLLEQLILVPACHQLVALLRQNVLQTLNLSRKWKFQILDVQLCPFLVKHRLLAVTTAFWAVIRRGTTNNLEGTVTGLPMLLTQFRDFN